MCRTLIKKFVFIPSSSCEERNSKQKEKTPKSELKDHVVLWELKKWKYPRFLMNSRLIVCFN